MIDTLTRSRWIRTTTAAGLVPLLLVTSVPACALRSDTSSIPAEGWVPQAAQQRRPGGAGATSGVRFPVGCPDPVRLVAHRSRAGRHQDRGCNCTTTKRRRTAGESRGRFHAATADTLTLTLEDLTATSSSTRTLVKSAVHSVSVRRPDQEAIPGMEHSRGLAQQSSP